MGLCDTRTAVTVPVGAENGIDPDKEKALIVYVGGFKKDISTDNGGTPEAICQGTVSPCFWLQSAFSPTLLYANTSNVTQT